MQKELDCLLIWPPFDFPDGIYSNLRTFEPPLGLLALAAYVREYNSSVEILDCNMTFENTDAEFEKYVIEKYSQVAESVKVVGFTTTTPTIYACFRMAEVCRRVFPNAKIVLGGVHTLHLFQMNL